MHSLVVLLAFAEPSPAQPAVDTSIPCAGRSAHAMLYPVNENATLHFTSTFPSYALCLRTRELLDSVMRSKGRWPDCDVLPSLMPSPGLFVDVGANIGACSILMASLGHRVISIEPTPPTFVALAAGVAGNAPNPSWDVRLINAGVSNSTGPATIFSGPGNSGSALTTGVGKVKYSAYRSEKMHRASITERWKRHAIELKTLDHLVREHVGLMKMDCQGHELRALLGGVDLIKNFGVSVIKLEFYPPGLRQVGDDPIALLHFLDMAGYDLFHHGVPLLHQDFASLVDRYANFFTDIVARARIAVQ